MDNLNPFMLKSCLEVVVWFYDIFDNNLEIKNDFTKYWKGICL